MNKPFHAGFQFDKGAVIGDADDFAFDPRAALIFLFSGRPWVLGFLFQAERDFFMLFIVLQHDDFDLVAKLEQFGGMVDAAPRNIRDVQQAVNPAEINKDAVIGDIFDDAFDDFTFCEIFQRFLTRRFALLFQD